MNNFTKKIAAIAMAAVMSAGMAVTANAVLEPGDEVVWIDNIATIASVNTNTQSTTFYVDGALINASLTYTTPHETTSPYADAYTTTNASGFDLKTNLWGDTIPEPETDDDSDPYSAHAHIDGHSEWGFISSGHRATRNGQTDLVGLQKLGIYY